MSLLKQFDKNIGFMNNSKDLKPNEYFNKSSKQKFIGIVVRGENLENAMVSEMNQTE